MDNEYAGKKSTAEERKERRKITPVDGNNSRWGVVNRERPFGGLPQLQPSL
jgi:hypothetical protein